MVNWVKYTVKFLPLLRIILVGLFATSISGLEYSPDARGEEVREACLTNYTALNVSGLPPSLANDQSLVALKELYGDRIKIEDRPEGPWLYLHAEDKTRDIEKMREVRISSYNMLNVIEADPAYKIDSITGEKVRLPTTIAKSSQNLEEEGRLITQEKPDIFFAEEVQSLKVSQLLNQGYLDQQFRPVILEGNDQRGINILLSFKRDLPFDIEIQSHRKVMGDFMGTQEPVFSRDLPITLLRPKGAKETDPPFLIFLPEHLKSKRDGINDPESKIKRGIQIAKSLEIKERLEAQYPGVPIIMEGDFNGDLRHDAELAPLWSRGKYKDVFDLTPHAIPIEKRITHTFHPLGAPVQASQLDGILVSGAGQKPGLVKDAHIVRYVDANGNEKPIPRTFEERKKNPSDHFMISTVLDLTQLLPKQASAP